MSVTHASGHTGLGGSEGLDHEAPGESHWLSVLCPRRQTEVQIQKSCTLGTEFILQKEITN